MSAKLQINTLIIRFVIFCLLFVVVSGILGPWIISSRLLYEFNFYLYANFGKMVIFSSIVFFLLAKDKLRDFKLQEYTKSNLLFIIASFSLIPVFFQTGKSLLEVANFTSNLALTFSANLLIIIIPFLLIPGVFGLKFLADFPKIFQKELKICLTISLVYSFLIWQVWKFWPYFSNLVLLADKFLFSLTFSNVFVIPPRTLSVNGFAVSIAEACSGLDSLFLFSTLYLIIGILDWKLFDKAKFILMFIPVAIGLILVNILRVYLLILIGVLISPDLTLKLFHTYVGMILFIIYFALFWKLFHKWLLLKQ